MFISHSTEDKGVATKLKEKLAAWNMSCFVASGDLTPGYDSNQELVEEIKSCRVFLVLVSQNYHKSAYANQELGFALCHGRQILPICLDDALPKAFIWGKHCIGCGDIDINTKIVDIAKSIEHLSKLEEKVDSQSANFYISNLSRSESWEEAGHWTKKINAASRFTADEINQIALAVIKNDQVQKSWAARPSLRRILLEHKNLLSETTKSGLESTNYL